MTMTPIPSASSSALGAIAAAAGIPAPLALAARPVSVPGPLPAPDVSEPVSAAAWEQSEADVRALPIFAQADGLSVGPARVHVSYNHAFNGIADETARVSAVLESTYTELRRQGQGWYQWSLLSASVGFGLVAVAIVALLLRQTTTGVVTTASSLLPNAIASMFFIQARRADKRLDAVTKELTISRERYALLDITNTINDPHLQNKLKAEIVRKVLANSQGASAVGAD